MFDREFCGIVSKLVVLIDLQSNSELNALFRFIIPHLELFRMMIHSGEAFGQVVLTKDALGQGSIRSIKWRGLCQ